ncbi:MAG TPA: hypothetical protein VIU61_27665, partial [Kofleriaceae bacterium]
MVAPASRMSSYLPSERPRLAVASDGSLAAVVEATRVTIVDLPSGSERSAVGTDADASATEAVWVGTRLLVLSRFTAHSVVLLIDPNGPRTISEIRLESPMRVLAAVGNHALVVGASGSLSVAILTATEAQVTPYQFPTRAVPLAAGTAAGQFVVGLPGSIEEWDPQSRMPKRRLRLPRPAVITHVGGSDRVVWVTTQQDPTRIDVIPLVNRGQPKAHDLPEPISQICGHPRSDVVLCVGADSGRMYAVDLDGRTQTRRIEIEGIDRVEAMALVVGKSLGALAAQTKRRLAVIALDGREVEARPSPTVEVPAPPAEAAPRRSSLTDPDDDPAPAPSEPMPLGFASIPDKPPPPAPPAKEPAAPTSLFRHASSTTTRGVAPPPNVRTDGAPAATIAQNLSEKFSAWRDKMRQAQPRAERSANLPWIDTRPSWRDEAVIWARAVAAGSVERDAPLSDSVHELAERFELPATLVPAIVLLYGAHLAGERGVAPFDIARVLGRRWDEALGRGLLASRGLARFEDSRVVLSPAIQRALDELPIQHGTLVGEPGTVALLGPCVVVGHAPLVDLAERHLAHVGGAILAGH